MVLAPPLGLVLAPAVDEPAPPDADEAPAEGLPDESSLEPPHAAMSETPPTSIKPKPYFSDFIDSSSGARAQLLSDPSFFS
jgi:hypothetical protein